MLEYTGFIGYGFVGKACHKAFEHNTKAIIIDPKYSDTTIDDLVIYNPKLVFISINAPTLDCGSVDASSIYEIFAELLRIQYKGIVVLKSTLPPAIVHDLYIKYGHTTVVGHTGTHGVLRYVYSPEFLRESSWEKDAISPDQILLAGDYNDCRELELLYNNHSQIKYTPFRIVDYRVASLAKYTINSFLANKVTFMNQIYQLYGDTFEGNHVSDADWKEFIGLLSSDMRIGGSHLAVPGPDGKFGYGGSCFPKDMKALIGFDHKERLSILRETEIANTKIRLVGDIDRST